MAPFEHEQSAPVAVSAEPALQRSSEGPGPNLGVTSVLALQRSAGNAAVARALAGRSVGLDPFPHRATLEARLGRALPGSAVVDPARCAAVGAEAFTEGTRTSFASAAPRLEVAAHEATHQLQHAGATRDAGLGAEGHAQQVARAVIEDRSITHLLGQRGRDVAPALRRYTEIPVATQTASEWSAGGKPVRVAEDGSMAVKQDSQYGSHRLWAAASRIALANSALETKDSVVRLKAGSETIQGTAPDGGPSRTLSSVEPENLSTGTKGTTMSIWADCGRSARDVMGVGGGTGKNYADVTAKYEDGSEKQTAASDPKGMADEILKKTLGKNLLSKDTAADGWKRYWKLKPAARDQFDRDHGLNRYAEPDVGDGFTMASGGNDYPGKATWNFHWAGVVMSNGTDHVTLENYAVGNAEKKNTDWDFQMYGPPSKAGQTFHDQHKATQQHGDAPTTMAVGQR